ncbi:MAG: ribokinase, partial [Candidatus Viridilinea halotolerans]
MATKLMLPNYLALGHLTHDVLPAGALMPGGTVRYAALTARELGYQAAVVSSGCADLVGSLPDDVALHLQPAPVTTTFANRYTAYGREQWLHALAPVLTLDRVSAAWREAPMIHIGPVANECALAHILDWVAPHALVGLTPQGMLRTWDAPLPARVRPLHWQ